MKLVYGVQRWEAVERSSATEIMDEADWFEDQVKALDAAEAILNAKPAGCVRVTVGRFYEGGEYHGEMYDDKYIFDKDVA